MGLFMKIYYFIIFILLFLIGCSAVPKTWEAMGGSKSDGTIELSYVYRPILDSPPSNEQGAIILAIKHCRAWGYSNAEAFGGSTKACHTKAINSEDCTSWRVTKVYQCILEKI